MLLNSANRRELQGSVEASVESSSSQGVVPVTQGVALILLRRLLRFLDGVSELLAFTSVVPVARRACG
jgi:hypothetical protein